MINVFNQQYVLEEYIGDQKTKLMNVDETPIARSVITSETLNHLVF